MLIRSRPLPSPLSGVGPGRLHGPVYRVGPSAHREAPGRRFFLRVLCRFWHTTMRLHRKRTVHVCVLVTVVALWLTPRVTFSPPDDASIRREHQIKSAFPYDVVTFIAGGRFPWTVTDDKTKTDPREAVTVSGVGKAGTTDCRTRQPGRTGE